MRLRLRGQGGYDNGAKPTGEYRSLDHVVAPLPRAVHNQNGKGTAIQG